MNGKGTPILSLRNICKKFPGVIALNKVSLELYRGEIVGLVGENGAGKSTLMKILTGAYQKDAGDIILDGETVEIHSTHDGRQQGISIIYQELSLIPQLTVTENLFLGNMLLDSHGLVDWAGMRQKAQEALKQMNLDISPDTLIRDLNIAQCQVVEICRAIVINSAKVLVLDEPTSSLVDREIEAMFELLRKLREQGLGIIYITHRLDELFEITDRIVVLKDGENSSEMETSQVDKQGVVHAMVGRELEDYYPTHGGVRGEKLLEVRHLSQGKMVKDVSFEAYRGEILGITGLVGAGRSEMLMSIYGAMPEVSGSISFDGHEGLYPSPREAINAGIALGPEDRKTQGLILAFSVLTNTTLAKLKRFLNKRKLLDLKKERSLAEQYVKKMRTKLVSMDGRVGELSGGNQQKVIIAKLMFTEAKLLLLDEPTRGIDVGAKAEIYSLMRQVADDGNAVIMVSSELNEILGVSDRILVMHEGRICGEFMRGEADERKIMSIAVGGKEE